MKESIGMTWIFVIVLTFIILFTAYVAISVNYSKAFRLKSYIVGEIEQNGGWNGLEQDITSYLTAQGYVAHSKCPTYANWNLKGSAGLSIGDERGVCIYQMKPARGNDNIKANSSYYRVTTFFTFDLPVVNLVLPPIAISGDTQYVYDFS